MANISLRWISMNALIEWTERHFYYLPESITEPDVWCSTMQALISELNEQGFHVDIHIYANETVVSDEPDYMAFPYSLIKPDTPTRIADNWFIRTHEHVFKLLTYPNTFPKWEIIHNY